jgi:hypothetical protein
MVLSADNILCYQLITRCFLKHVISYFFLLEKSWFRPQDSGTALYCQFTKSFYYPLIPLALPIYQGKIICNIDCWADEKKKIFLFPEGNRDKIGGRSTRKVWGDGT